MHKMVDRFRDNKRKRHHINSLAQKREIVDFLEKNHISTKKNVVIYDTTGYNITANLNEYIETGFRDIQLHCCEIDKQLIKPMHNKKNRDNLHNVYIHHSSLLKAVLNSGIKIKHINYDGTSALHTLLNNGLMSEIEAILQADVTTSAFTFELLYQINQTVKYFNKHKEQILCDLYIEIEELAKRNGYKIEKLYSKRFKDGYEMQPLVIGFKKL